MGSANSKSVTHLVVMGVAGSGKTTASRSLRELTGWPIAEADDFHPAANIEKMSAGIPLTCHVLGYARQYRHQTIRSGSEPAVCNRESDQDFRSRCEGSGGSECGAAKIFLTNCTD